MSQVHAPLRFAEVLHARHDFLAGIAALLEIHATNEFKIRHLRHELLLCLRQNNGDAGMDVEPIPAYAADRLRMLAERLPERWCILRGSADLKARVAEFQHARLFSIGETERQLRQLAELL